MEKIKIDLNQVKNDLNRDLIPVKHNQSKSTSNQMFTFPVLICFFRGTKRIKID